MWMSVSPSCDRVSENSFPVMREQQKGTSRRLRIVEESHQCDERSSWWWGGGFKKSKGGNSFLILSRPLINISFCRMRLMVSVCREVSPSFPDVTFNILWCVNDQIQGAQGSSCSWRSWGASSSFFSTHATHERSDKRTIIELTHLRWLNDRSHYDDNHHCLSSQQSRSQEFWCLWEWSYRIKEQQQLVKKKGNPTGIGFTNKRVNLRIMSRQSHVRCFTNYR